MCIRDSLYPERRLSDSRPEAEPAAGENPGQVRQDEENLPEGTPSHPLQPDAAEREVVPAPSGDRRDRPEQTGADDALSLIHILYQSDVGRGYGDLQKRQFPSEIQSGYERLPESLSLIHISAPEPARELPQITEGQTFDKVTAAVTEHFTAPPKSYTDVIFCERKEWIGIEERSSA